MSKLRLGTLIVLAVLIVLIPWLLKFGTAQFSNESENWAHFSTYISGILTPLLAFASLILLIDTVRLQNQANKDLSEQTKLSSKLSLQTSFENLFFNLLRTQSENFKNFRVEQEEQEYCDSAAVEKLLMELEELDRISTLDDDQRYRLKVEVVESFNENKQIYNVVRTFSNLQQQIKLSLTEAFNFSEDDRYKYYMSLINLTSFHILMLVMVKLKYLPCEKTQDIEKNQELMGIFRDTKLLDFKDRI